MIPFNYHHLYYFHAVAKAGSIAKACENLLLAQPTVSAQLKQFEASLGRRLFDRVNQRLVLTDDGRLVLDYAESIFDLGRELQDALRDKPKGGRPALQVGVLSGTPGAFGEALLESVLKADPSAHVTVHEDDLEDLLEELRQQKLDILLTDAGVRGRNQEEFLNHPAGKIPVLLAAAPALAKRFRKIPADLDGAPFILPSFPGQVYQEIRDLFARWKVKPNVVAEVRDVELARRLAVSGHGIAPINAYALAADLPPGKLVVLNQGRSIGLYESVFLVTRRRKRPNPLAERLIKEFRLSPPKGRGRMYNK